MNHIPFQRDSVGLVLPTLRNKDIVDSLIKIYGSKSEIPESLKEDVSWFYMYWDIWKENIGTDFYSTPETAKLQHKAKLLTDELDKKYLEGK